MSKKKDRKPQSSPTNRPVVDHTEPLVVIPTAAIAAREGIKAYALVIVDRWGVHAATTATPVDDLLVAGLRAAVERYFDDVYDTLLDKIGSQEGSPEFGSVSVEGLIDAIIGAPHPAGEITFDAPNGQVLELVKALLPIVLKWYFAV